MYEHEMQMRVLVQSSDMCPDWRQGWTRIIYDQNAATNSRGVFDGRMDLCTPGNIELLPHYEKIEHFFFAIVS